VIAAIGILLLAFFVMWSWNGSLAKITNGAKRMSYGNAIAFVFLLFFLSFIVFVCPLAIK